MTEEKIKYIESITIKKLWGEVDIDWQLNPKVNILVGKNGSGKSTMLNIIESIILKEYIDIEFDTEFVQINFDSHKYVSFERIILSEKDILNDITDKNYRDFKNYGDLISVIKSRKPKYQIEDNNSYTYIKAIEVYKQNFASYIVKFNNIINNINHSSIISIFDGILLLVKISTFEILVLQVSALEFQTKKNKDIKTSLDFILSQLIDKFKSYQLTLKKSIENEIREKDELIKTLSFPETISNEDLEKLRQLIRDKEKINNRINYHKDLFLELINELFAETKKTIDFDADNSIIFRKPNDKIITAYQLSSGEKQILIILLQVLMQNNQPSIILMDEPELSLHLSWQLKLIDMIQSLNQNCQLIIATHAPGIFSKGWKDKVTDIRNIIRN